MGQPPFPMYTHVTLKMVIAYTSSFYTFQRIRWVLAMKGILDFRVIPHVRGFALKTFHYSLLLWSKGKVTASHADCPGLIPGRKD